MDNLSCLIIPETAGAGGWTESVDTVDGLRLSRDTLELLPGSSAMITVNITPWNAGDRTVTWSSSDESVATVNEDGIVWANLKRISGPPPCMRRRATCRPNRRRA